MEKSDIKALTFDLFGTILDLGSSLTPYIAEFLEAKGADVSADRFWDQWRARQRIEQYQDTLVMLGHSGYPPGDGAPGVRLYSQLERDSNVER